jgi:hypothetical protein
MRDNAKDAVGYGLGAVLVVVAILIALWGFGWVGGGIAKWWNDTTYIKPVTQADKDRERENAVRDLELELKDPTSYAAIRKKCLDSGGFPGSDGWGNIQCHEKEK